MGAAEDHIYLVSKEQHVFTVPLYLARMNNKMIQEWTENWNADRPEQEKYINCFNLSSDILNKIIDFDRYYYKHRMNPISIPLLQYNIENNVKDKWYIEFLDGMEYNKLCELLNGASYINNTPLMELLGIKIGLILNNASFSELQDVLGFKDVKAPMGTVRESLMEWEKI